MESTWLKTGHKIRDLQETLFDNKALPSLRGASSSAIGFISEVPAMGYQTYFLGPLAKDSPNQALHSDGSVAAPGNRTISSILAAKPPRIIQGRSLALTLAEGTGQLVSLKAGCAPHFSPQKLPWKRIANAPKSFQETSCEASSPDLQ